MELREELQMILNQCCAENESNTPDFILAQYLFNCLSAFDSAVKARDDFYSVHLEPANKYFLEE
jgi:hypothetical protein